MPLFRRKPIVISAEQWFPDKPVAGVEREKKVAHERRYYVTTLEGPLFVSPGDWIITGVRGELHPCKPDIFAETYEPA